MCMIGAIQALRRSWARLIFAWCLLALPSLAAAESSPILDTVTPPTIMNRVPTTLTLAGQHFQPGAVIVYTGPASYEALAVFRSSTRLELPFVPNGPTGIYTIQVRNPDGNLSNGKPLTVVDPPAAPFLSSVTPATLINGVPATLTLTGANFTATTHFRAYGAPGQLVSDLSANDGAAIFRLINSNRIEISAAPALPYGSYQVEAADLSGISNRLTITLLPATTMNLRKLSSWLYTNTDGGTHPVDAYQFTEFRSGLPAYFLLVQPVDGRGVRTPYPTIVINAPYTLFPSPTSPDPVDAFWTNYLKTPPNFDLTLPPYQEIQKCSTARCPMWAASVQLTDLPRVGDWVLRNGYAVAFTLGRFYAARDLLSAPYEVIGVIEALKTLSPVDSNRIGLMGDSLGGFETIYPLSRSDRPLSIQAAVAVAPPVDFRALYSYHYTFLPTVQPANLLAQTHDWVDPYYNRLFKSLGPDPSHPTWDVMTSQYVASRMGTPLLLIAGTDDMMLPVSQSLNLYSTLKGLGKPVNKVIYQHGLPPFATKSAVEWAHGTLDQRAAAKISILTNNFFMHHMPSDYAGVTYRDPSEVDLVAFLATLRQAICDSSDEKPNATDLILHAANPRVTYLSSDARIPTGTGPTAVAVAVNIVWTKEGIAWTGDTVSTYLRSGLLPSVCGEVPTPVLTRISPSAAIRRGQAVTFEGLNFQPGAVIVYTGSSTGFFPVDYVSWSQFRFTDTAKISPGSYLLQVRNPDGKLSNGQSITVTTAPDTTPPTVAFATPSDGATVSGVVPVHISADDNVGVATVELYVDGAMRASWAGASGTYRYDWDSARAPDGAHTLEARATDAAGNHAAPKTVMVSVQNVPANQPPAVNAGADQTITLPASAVLHGAATDDGLPNPPGRVTTTWSMVSGPGTVTIPNASALDTTASFSVAGSYALRLTATDGLLQTSDGVAITVRPSALRGDLTGDGRVTLADLRLLIRMLIGQVTPDLAKAELTGDGVLTLADLRELIRILVAASP